MAHIALTAIARFPRIALDHCVELGIERAEILRVMGLTEKSLQDPDSRVTLDSLWALWRLLIERSPDRLIGLEMSRDISVRDWGLVGYTMLYSRTLLDAFQRLCRYGSIMTETLRIELEPGPAHTRVRFDQSAEALALRHPVDMRLALLARAASEITGRRIAPVSIHIPHPVPRRLVDYQKFFDAPLVFSEPFAMLVFSNQDLAREVVAADESLVHYLDTLSDTVLKSLVGRGTVIDRVRRAIWNELSSGQPTLERAAQRLGLSTRSLQRRLREEGATFAQLLDELRREMAQRLLADPDLAVYEVAFLLGYSEPSTFFRAFRRWHGISPQAYRRRIA